MRRRLSAQESLEVVQKGISDLKVYPKALPMFSRKDNYPESLDISQKTRTQTGKDEVVTELIEEEREEYDDEVDKVEEAPEMMSPS